MPIHKLKFTLHVFSFRMTLKPSSSFVLQNNPGSVNLGPIQSTVSSFQISERELSISVTGGGKTEIQVDVDTRGSILQAEITQVTPDDGAVRIEVVGVRVENIPVPLNPIPKPINIQLN